LLIRISYVHVPFRYGQRTDEQRENMMLFAYCCFVGGIKISYTGLAFFARDS